MGRRFCARARRRANGTPAGRWTRTSGTRAATGATNNENARHTAGRSRWFRGRNSRPRPGREGPVSALVARGLAPTTAPAGVSQDPVFTCAACGFQNSMAGSQADPQGEFARPVPHKRSALRISVSNCRSVSGGLPRENWPLVEGRAGVWPIGKMRGAPGIYSRRHGPWMHGWAARCRPCGSRGGAAARLRPPRTGPFSPSAPSAGSRADSGSCRRAACRPGTRARRQSG